MIEREREMTCFCLGAKEPKTTVALGLKLRS